MATLTAIAPSSEFRAELARRGGDTAARCFQCATCGSVCELAPAEAPFPRRQMLYAQWGLADRLAADPAVWLCHQCGDCSTRCPRDARPGTVIGAVRSLVIERLAAPRFLGRVVADARTTWPLLLGVPILFWAALVLLAGPALPAHLAAYEEIVPHAFIYGVFFPVAVFVLLAAVISGRRFWALLGSSGPPRQGSFLGALAGVVGEIATHGRFGSCDEGAARRWGHLALFWGFVGAAVTSGLLIVWMYGFGVPLPLPQAHPVKILGNLSALLLVVGGVLLTLARLRDGERVGVSTAFDRFFLATVVLVLATGVLVEVVRLAAVPPPAAAALYIIHLGVVLALFLSFPYSKFAHMLYRTLAMVHQRMTDASVGQEA